MNKKSIDYKFYKFDITHGFVMPPEYTFKFGYSSPEEEKYWRKRARRRMIGEILVPVLAIFAMSTCFVIATSGICAMMHLIPH